MSDDKSRSGRRATDDAVFEASTDPHRLARVFVRAYGLRPRGGRQLRYWRAESWTWNGRRYDRLTEADLRSDLTHVVKHELDQWARHRQKPDGNEPKPVDKVTRSLISNVFQALQGIVFVPGALEQPVWLGSRAPGRELLAMENGLIDLAVALAVRPKVPRVLRHSSEWFSPVCLDYSFDPTATCPRWLAFLTEIFESDAERIALVQELFGYCLVFDTSLHRFFVLIGDGANGKSVLLAVLDGLLGDANVSQIRLEFFGERFQLTPTLGKLANLSRNLEPRDGSMRAFSKRSCPVNR